MKYRFSKHLVSIFDNVSNATLYCFHCFILFSSQRLKHKKLCFQQSILIQIVLQGARSILGGIQNLQLASDVSPPTLLIRQQGKLAPPLLISTIQHSNLSASDLELHSPGMHKPAAAAASTPAARSFARLSQLGSSAFKTSAASPAASALLTGRLSRQVGPQAAGPSAIWDCEASPMAAPGFGHMEFATVSTPQGDATTAAGQEDATTAAGQDDQEGARTPGTMTQDEWDAFMQTGSVPPSSTKIASGSKTTGRKRAVRPVLKKQRMNTIALD